MGARRGEGVYTIRLSARREGFSKQRELRILAKGGVGYSGLPKKLIYYSLRTKTVTLGGLGVVWGEGDL